MTTSSVRTRCITCGKENATIQCRGCFKDFCFKDYGNHRQELSQQLEEVDVNRNHLQESFSELIDQPRKHFLIQQIDTCEQESIQKIRETAEESRQVLLVHINENNAKMKTQLTKLTDQLRQSRDDSDFFETDLTEWKKELKQLTERLSNLSNVIVRENSKPLVTQINVDVPSRKLKQYAPNIPVDVKWIPNGITVAGGNNQGDALDQLFCPCGVYVDENETIYIADTKNHRIMEWKCDAITGKIVAGGKGQGNGIDQLNRPTDVIVDEQSNNLIICDRGNRRVVLWPREDESNGETIVSDIDCFGLTMDNDGYLYVSDCKRNEVRRWRIDEDYGVVVAGGNNEGFRLDQLSFPLYVFLDQKNSIYISDTENRRTVKWTKDATEGDIVAGGRGSGTSLTQLLNPQGIVVDQSGTVYVADFGNNRITCWAEGAVQGRVIVGGNGQGEKANQLHGPNGLAFDRHGHLYVADSNNHRVQKFKYLNSDSSSS